jgi:hypothetical protein
VNGGRLIYLQSLDIKIILSSLVINLIAKLYTLPIGPISSYTLVYHVGKAQNICRGMSNHTKWYAIEDLVPLPIYHIYLSEFRLYIL